jgi:UDP-N-acetylglucosamine acyltransferase
MIHPSAQIHPQAEIDPSVEIGPWCTVGPHVKIGKGTRLISHVVLDGHTQIGEHNTIFPFAVLGAVPQDLKYKGENTQLVIGNHNTIREGVTMNLGTVQGGGVTRLGNHGLVMAYSHLGHDCLVGNHCIIANSVALAGHVTLEDYVTLGGITGISQFVRIGAHAYIGGFSGLDKDIPPYAIATGSRPTVHLRGANIVGLRRRGYKAEVIQVVNETIKLWARPDVQKDQCLLEIESQYGEYPEVQNFIQFIKKSEQGVVR